MNPGTSRDTQATLLLHAPLVTAGTAPPDPILKATEFRAVRARLAASGRPLGDLLGTDAPSLVEACADVVPAARMHALLGRGFRLAQALDQWAARSTWVIGATDPAYPARLRHRFADDAPPLLYGCGNADLLDAGGLAVVGSRDGDDEVLAWATEVGSRAARSRCHVVSGGTRGVDIAAMAGALHAGGTACGVLADTLFSDILDARYRDHLRADTLVLVSPNDPRQRFFASLRMQRNKYIYALADAALVVASGLKEGGTWAGAEEQLRRLRHVPVYVRVTPEASPGLTALQALGARPWPDPVSPLEFARALLPTRTRPVADATGVAWRATGEDAPPDGGAPAAVDAPSAGTLPVNPIDPIDPIDPGPQLALPF